jgi:protein phosphatase
MRFDAASISEAGPRPINEDGVAVWSPQNNALVAAIADGLGGMGGGGDASHIALATLRRAIALPMGEDDLRAAVKEAHAEILKAQLGSPDLSRMATTLTAGVFTADSLLGVHCGDSRASIARGTGIVRLTSDHSEGERLFKAGKLTKEELREYPRKNILDSALGVHTEPRIDIFRFDLVVGDKVLFTTDGVHEKVLLREMREVAERHSRAQGFVEEIAEAVLLRKPDDNFSVVAVFVT